MIDKNWLSKYKDIIVLAGQADNGLLIYPTVFANGFIITSNGAQIALLLDAEGRRVKTIPLTSGSNYVNASALHKGLYILVTADGENQRIIKD